MCVDTSGALILLFHDGFLKRISIGTVFFRVFPHFIMHLSDILVNSNRLSPIISVLAWLLDRMSTQRGEASGLEPV